MFDPADGIFTHLKGVKISFKSYNTYIYTKAVTLFPSTLRTQRRRTD